MRDVLFDTGPFVIFAIGQKDPSLLGSHKRTKDYCKEDYEALIDSIKGYDRIVVTPHVLSECSNLIRQIGDPLMSELTGQLGDIIKAPFIKESYIPTASAVDSSEFSRLGVVDANILDMVKAGYVLLTCDHNLYCAASKISSERAINFNYLREL